MSVEDKSPEVPAGDAVPDETTAGEPGVVPEGGGGADGATKTLTQEQVNQIVQERLARQEEQIRKEYQGFDELKAKAEKYQEYLDSKKTDDEKAQEQAEQERAAHEALLAEKQALEAKVQELELGALRAEIAAAKGIPPALASRLRGTTAEEIEADCAELLAAVKPNSPTKDRPGGGSSSGEGDVPFDPNKVVDSILR